MVGQTSMAKCKALTGSAVKGLTAPVSQFSPRCRRNTACDRFPDGLREAGVRRLPGAYRFVGGFYRCGHRWSVTVLRVSRCGTGTLPAGQSAAAATTDDWSQQPVWHMHTSWLLLITSNAAVAAHAVGLPFWGAWTTCTFEARHWL